MHVCLDVLFVTWLSDVYVYLNIRLHLISTYKNFPMMQGCFPKQLLTLYMSEICDSVIDTYIKLLCKVY